MRRDVELLIAIHDADELRRTAQRARLAKSARAAAERARGATGRRGPGAVVGATAWLMAIWCGGFAAVNIAFEITGHFDRGSTAVYARGLSVLDWLVAGLKVVGAAIAVLSISVRPRRLSQQLRGVALWGAFATLALYVLGSLVEALGMATGIAGNPVEITPRGVQYVLFFLAAAAGYGILAIAHFRRHRLSRVVPLLGVLAAPVLIGLVLLVVPTWLMSVGVLPS